MQGGDPVSAAGRLATGISNHHCCLGMRPAEDVTCSSKWKMTKKMCLHNLDASTFGRLTDRQVDKLETSEQQGEVGGWRWRWRWRWSDATERASERERKRERERHKDRDREGERQRERERETERDTERERERERKRVREEGGRDREG